LPGQKKGNNWFPSTLLGAGFFGYFFFVAGDKEKVTFQPKMLWQRLLKATFANVAFGQEITS